MYLCVHSTWTHTVIAKHVYNECKVANMNTLNFNMQQTLQNNNGREHIYTHRHTHTHVRTHTQTHTHTRTHTCDFSNVACTYVRMFVDITTDVQDARRTQGHS